MTTPKVYWMVQTTQESFWEEQSKTYLAEMQRLQGVVTHMQECLNSAEKECVETANELTHLRISVARIAQAAEVSLNAVDLVDDAPYHAIRERAAECPRGWNSLAANIVWRLTE